jgi:hypothetical protein
LFLSFFLFSRILKYLFVDRFAIAIKWNPRKYASVLQEAGELSIQVADQLVLVTWPVYADLSHMETRFLSSSCISKRFGHYIASFPRLSDIAPPNCIFFSSPGHRYNREIQRNVPSLMTWRSNAV